jgi:uncharacterized protein YdeI (YjbR/CyaY-like superfamily)
MKRKGADQLKTLEVRTRELWRQWLAKHHASAPGVWLVFFKRHTGRPSLDYEAAVEEALCFGWVDSLVKRLDDARYAIKVTPRKADSVWSDSNRRRYAKVMAAGLLTPAGVNRPPTSRRYASKGPSSAPAIIRQALDAAPAIERELKAHKAAWTFFEGLSPSHRRQYLVWIGTAKRDDTRRRRLREAIRLLAAGRMLGLK